MEPTTDPGAEPIPIRLIPLMIGTSRTEANDVRIELDSLRRGILSPDADRLLGRLRVVAVRLFGIAMRLGVVPIGCVGFMFRNVPMGRRVRTIPRLIGWVVFGR